MKLDRSLHLVACGLLAGCGARADSDHLPAVVLGSLDSIDAAGNAAGWALVPAWTGHPLETAVYCDGDADSGTLIYTVRANQQRDDVAQATGVPGKHGFTFTVPANLQDGQVHTLHQYGLGPAGLVELEGSPTTFQVAGAGSGNAPRADGSAEVQGFVDSIDAVGIATGWTLVPSFTTHPIQIAVFAEGDAIQFTSRANVDRPDLAMLFGSTHHGFSAQIPEELMDDQPHRVTVYGVGPHGFAELAKSPVDIRLKSPRPIGALDGVDASGIASGWALVPALDPAAIDVALSVDGQALATVHADMGDHRFAFALPEALHDGKDHVLSASGIGPRATIPLGDAAFHLAPAFHGRHGIVHADGRTYVDDDGPFYPLGGTVMWAMWGWKYDRARLEDNLKFLGEHHYDYIRILAEVDWAGEAIDPGWPDHAQVLGELIDYAYDTYGLRTEITIIGGGAGVDVMALAQRVAGVVNAGRRQKILDIEVANESYQRPISLATMRAVGSYLIQALPGQLVALSSAEGLGTYVPNSTNFIADTLATYLQQGTANLLTIHMDRTFGDAGWREVRQPWDWKDFPYPISHNEPIGPRSSVAEEVDPVRLATLRAVGIINGVGAFILHNGSGVTGMVDPAHNRPANLWEVPNIDAIMAAVRGVDALLPAHAGDGQHWNNGWAGNPWNADAFWADGADHGVNRNYTVATPDGWISVEAGIKDHVVMTPRQHSRVEVFDILTGKVGEVELAGGQTYTLVPTSRDSNGYGALIVIGHFL